MLEIEDFTLRGRWEILNVTFELLKNDTVRKSTPIKTGKNDFYFMLSTIKNKHKHQRTSYVRHSREARTTKAVD